MPEIFLGLLILGYSLLVMLGASDACGRLLGKIARGYLPPSYRLPLGFAVFPVLLTWTGFLGVWRIPYLTELAGIACAAAGLLFLIRLCREISTGDIRRNTRVYALPAVVL